MAQISADSVGRLIGNATWVWTYDPANGVLSSLLASGRLGIIRNDSLRTELAGWQALVSDIQEDEQAAWRVMDERIGPFLDRHLAWRTLADLADDAYPLGPSDFPNDVLALHRNREFENIVANKLTTETNILSYYQPLARSLERMLQLVDQELESGI